MLGEDRLRRQGMFRPEAVARLLGDHRAGRVDNRKKIWTLFMFQLWHRKWVERA
jgi:asparagine synthase (glutamine-hydrolysing)